MSGRSFTVLFVTRGETVTIQITGTGPSGTTCVDPARDPARRT